MVQPKCDVNVGEDVRRKAAGHHRGAGRPKVGVHAKDVWRGGGRVDEGREVAEDALNRLNVDTDRYLLTYRPGVLQGEAFIRLARGDHAVQLVVSRVILVDDALCVPDENSSRGEEAVGLEVDTVYLERSA